MWGFKQAKKTVRKPRAGQWVSGKQAAAYAQGQHRKAARKAARRAR